jgi:hypothetical protein
MPSVRLEIIPGAEHRMQLSMPDAVASHMLAFARC